MNLKFGSLLLVHLAPYVFRSLSGASPRRYFWSSCAGALYQEQGVEVWEHTRTEVLSALSELGYSCTPFEYDERHVMNFMCVPKK